MNHRNAVFNFLLLPTLSQGIPGKNLRVAVMAMSSFMNRCICQKDLSFRRQRTLAQTGLNDMEWNACTTRGSGMPSAQVPPTLSSAVLSITSILGPSPCRSKMAAAFLSETARNKTTLGGKKGA